MGVRVVSLTAYLMVAVSAAAGDPPHGGGVFSALGASAEPAVFMTVKRAGADFVTVSTEKFLCPDLPEDVFEANLKTARESGVTVLACNGFLRAGRHTVVGPKPRHDAVVEWAEIVCRRLAKAGGKYVVLGSSTTRRLADGWTREQANEQYVALLKRLGPVARKHGIVIVVEQLRAEECNFLNRIDHLAELIRKTGHPNVKALADLYHMACVGDTPEDLGNNLDVVVHLEIAEKEERTYPGVKGDDFRPYFRVLRRHGWSGAMSIEGRGPPERLGPAFREIRRQEKE